MQVKICVEKWSHKLQGKIFKGCKLEYTVDVFKYLEDKVLHSGFIAPEGGVEVINGYLAAALSV